MIARHDMSNIRFFRLRNELPIPLEVMAAQCGRDQAGRARAPQPPTVSLTCAGLQLNRSPSSCDPMVMLCADELLAQMSLSSMNHSCYRHRPWRDRL